MPGHLPRQPVRHIADAAVFLCTDEARYVDGGFREAGLSFRAGLISGPSDPVLIAIERGIAWRGGPGPSFARMT